MFRSPLRLAILLTVSLLASSCLYVSQVVVEKQDLDAGDTSEIKVKTYPVSNAALEEGTTEGYAFVLIGYEGVERGTIKKIDVDGNYGGPFTATRDLNLRNQLLTDCQQDAIPDLDEFDVDEWQAWRTPAEITLEEDKGVKFRHSVSAPADASSGLHRLVIFSGLWLDDDGVPEEGESLCMGLSLIPIQVIGAG